MTVPVLPPLAPGSWPLLGHTPGVLRDPLGFFLRLRRGGAPVVRVRLAGRTMVVVNDSVLVRRVLVADYHRFDKGGPLFDAIRGLVGNGLVSCGAADHVRQRPLMQPAFHPGMMPHYARIMAGVMAEVTGGWRAGQTVRLDLEMHRVTMLAVSRTLLAAPSAAPAADRLAAAFPEILRGLFWRMLTPGWVTRLPLPANRRFDAQLAGLHRAIDEVVTDYRTSGTDHDDVLSRFIEAAEEEPDPRQFVHDQARTILAAGIETTASTIVWALRLLHEHPDVASALRAETDAVLGGRAPGTEDLPRLVLARNVITETMRLFPPTWLLSRVAVQDVDWPAGRIPAGSDVVFSPYALHRDPAVFPSPETFDPGRWQPGRVTAAQREGFLAFGAGRRKCIGDALGMAEATIALAMLTTRWRLDHHPRRTAARVRPRAALAAPPTPATVHPLA